MSYRVTTVSAIDGLAVTRKFSTFARALLVYKDVVASGYKEYAALYEMTSAGTIKTVIARHAWQKHGLEARSESGMEGSSI